MVIFLGEVSTLKEFEIFLNLKNKFNKFKIIKNINEIDNLLLSNSKFLLISDDLYNDFSKNKNYKKISEKIQISTLSNWLKSEYKLIPSCFFNSSKNIDSLKQINKYKLVIKRIYDIVISFIILISASPVILLSAILIYLEDRGPILYSQKRSGLFKKEINIFKLRSMKINAEFNKPKWAQKNDKRITKIGKIIGKTRIDELPQLISVIKGDMSLIGPRPERPQIEEELEKEIYNYELKHLMKPGITGWAQVNYPYGASLRDSNIKLSFDLYYMANFSFLLDFIIFFMTAFIVFTGRGATPGKYVKNINYF